MRISLEWLNSQSFQLASNGRELRYNCPNCDDHTGHLYVDATRTRWYCFKCGRGGRVEHTHKLEPNLEQYSKWEVFLHIENKTNPFYHPGTVELQKKMYKEISIVKSLPLHRALPHIEIAEDCESSEELTARQYLYSRGVTQKEISEYNISLSVEKNGPYKNSIIFPVYGKWDDLIYFVCRKFDKSKPKYTNAPWPKNDTLFIADANKGGPNYPWVVCEGIFDALAICRVGYNAIALLGKVPTSQQLKRLVERDRYLIYLDEDAFSHAINLKLQLSAVGTKAQLIVHKRDAAQLYLDDAPLLRSLLDGATKQLNEHKK